MAKLMVKGGGGEVGRAAIVIESSKSGKCIVMDYGVNFDEEDRPQLPLHVQPSKIECILLTHAHLDHIGAAPLFYISSKPKCYCTKVTRELGSILLEDFLKLSGYYLPFEHDEVKLMLNSIETINYGDEIHEGDFRIKVVDAGHIPGSCMFLIDVDDVRVLYTGDMNTIDTKLLRGAKPPSNRVDVVVIEATYGSSEHPPRSSVEKRFIEVVREVVSKGGTVLVPAFSVGRSQEIMCLLVEKAPDVDVYLDGMCRQVTEILLKNSKFLRDPELLRKAVENVHIVRGWDERRKVWKRSGVIIASAGMLKGGPALYYLKKLYKSKRNAILMVSFQAPGTPGRRILEEGVFEEGGELVNARIEWFDFSSHSDRGKLIEFLQNIKGVSKVVIVHSDSQVAPVFAKSLEEAVSGVDIVVAENGMSIEI